MHVKHFEENRVGKDYAIGDIHGMFGKLRVVLQEIGFDETKDRLFSVGDNVDRGPESEEVLCWLAKPWFHSVQGNHEVMVIDWCSGLARDRYTYSYNGGDWLINMWDNDPEHAKLFAEAFKKLPLAMSIKRDGKTYGVLHADVPVKDWNELDACQDTYSILWGRDRFYQRNETLVDNVELVYVGHTPLKKVITLGNCVYIDQGACFSDYGKLTVVELGWKPEDSC